MYMSVYAALVVGSFLIAFLSRATAMRRPGGLGQPLPNPLGFLIPAVALAVFSGLRDSIGDTNAYIDSYEEMVVESMDEYPFTFSGGMLYPYLEHLFNYREYDVTVLIMLAAVLAIVPAVYVVYKYSFPYELGIALFILTGYYSLSMNGVRQYAAAGILLLGTKYLMSEKHTDFIKYIPFVLLAWMMHSSALIMIPIFFVVRRKSWTPFTMVLLGGAVVLAVAFDAVLPGFLGVLEDTAYSQYANNGWFESGQVAGSSPIRVLVYLVWAVLSYVFREKLRFLHGFKWDVLCNLSVINLAFYIISLYNWIFARLAIYTSIYSVVAMTYIVYEGFNEENRNAFYWSSLGLFSAYYYNLKYTISGYSSKWF